MPELEEAWGSAAGRINGKYGEVSWTPIRYVNRVYSRSALAGLYRTARVGLVTPLRDGMNLVAKEYVAGPRIRRTRGVLILSRFAGAAIEFSPRPPGQSLYPESVAGGRSRKPWPCDRGEARAHQALLAAILDYGLSIGGNANSFTALRGDDVMARFRFGE